MSQVSSAPRSGPYEDTILIDCSRANCEEVKGNPTNSEHAIFTNKLGNGIKMNVGDKVSISSAFISEPGCGGQVIEFRGEKIFQETYTLKSSVITKSQFPRYTGDGILGISFANSERPTPETPRPFGDMGPFNAHRVQHTTTSQTFQLSDNEVNFEISYYKSTNGEGYFHLPRRWDITPKVGKPSVEGVIPTVKANEDKYIHTPQMLGSAPTSAMDTSLNYDCPQNGRACVSPAVYKLCPADWYCHEGLEHCSRVPIRVGDNAQKAVAPAEYVMPSTTPQGVPYAGGLWDLTDFIADAMYAPNQYDGHAQQSYQYKQKNDNSRYTIYAKDDCFYAEKYANLPNATNNNNNPRPAYELPEDIFPDAVPDPDDRYGSWYASRDDFLGTTGGDQTVSSAKEPSLTGYTKYTEIKNLKTPAGFSAPASIGETLTNQLNKTKSQKTIKGFVSPWLAPYTELNLKDNGTVADIGGYDTTFSDQRHTQAEKNYNGFFDVAPATAIMPQQFGTTSQMTQRQVDVSTVLESETFKSFACGNMETWSRENFVGYRGSDPADVGAVYEPAVSIARDYPDPPAPTTILQNPVKTQVGTFTAGVETKPVEVANIQYMSNYQYIGVKRPELFDAYREFWRDQIKAGYSWRDLDAFQCLSGVPEAEATNCPFITNVEWTEDNLLKFKAVFDAQGKYPELFEDYHFTNVRDTAGNSLYKSEGASSDHMRFIHLNQYTGSDPLINTVIQSGAPLQVNGTKPLYTSVSARMPLGDDNTNTPLNDPTHTNWTEYKLNDGTEHEMVMPVNASRNAIDFASAPLFIWYNDSDKDNTKWSGQKTNGLVYGCMYKFSLTDPALATPPEVLTTEESETGSSFEMGQQFNDDLWNAGHRDFIAFTTRNIGGIPKEVMTNFLPTADPDGFWTYKGLGTRQSCIPRMVHRANSSWGTFPASTGYGSGCGAGFDIHFNAYGTSVISLYSGYLAGDKYAVDTLKHGTDIPGIGTANEVVGEYYYDRSDGKPEKYHTNDNTAGPYTLTSAVSHSEEIDLNSTASITVGDMVEGETTDVVQTPCFVTEVVSGTKIKVSPAQTIANGKKLLFYAPITPISYENQVVSTFIRERYVGANQPLIAFDDKGERFNFQQLHSPLYIGNEANAGDGLTATATSEGTAVLEINRRLLGNDFTPEMMPYGTPLARNDTPKDEAPPIQAMNGNILPWQVYDADGGIFLEDFGLTEAQWNLSMWGVLGFSYAQFNAEAITNSRQTRINNIIETTVLGTPTTNANLEPSDVVKFRGNRYGASLYTYQPPIASCHGPKTSALQQGSVDYPVIVIDQTSAQINAQNLPRKMLRPYFLVKSNILGDMNYYGGADSGQSLPIVCVVNKENGFGDFYFQRGFDLEFTITAPKMLTSITTTIHDPDMRLSPCGPESSVLYKVVKQNNANLDVVQDVLQQQQSVVLKHREKLRLHAEEKARQGVSASEAERVKAGVGMGVGVGAGMDIPAHLQPINWATFDMGSILGISGGGGSSAGTYDPDYAGYTGSSITGSSNPRTHPSTLTAPSSPRTPRGPTKDLGTWKAPSGGFVPRSVTQSAKMRHKAGRKAQTDPETRRRQIHQRLVYERSVEKARTEKKRIPAGVKAKREAEARRLFED